MWANRETLSEHSRCFAEPINLARSSLHERTDLELNSWCWALRKWLNVVTSFGSLCIWSMHFENVLSLWEKFSELNDWEVLEACLGSDKGFLLGSHEHQVICADLHLGCSFEFAELNNGTHIFGQLNVQYEQRSFFESEVQWRVLHDLWVFDLHLVTHRVATQGVKHRWRIERVREQWVGTELHVALKEKVLSVFLDVSFFVKEVKGKDYILTDDLGIRNRSNDEYVRSPSQRYRLYLWEVLWRLRVCHCCGTVREDDFKADWNYSWKVFDSSVDHRRRFNYLEREEDTPLLLLIIIVGGLVDLWIIPEERLERILVNPVEHLLASQEISRIFDSLALNLVPDDLVNALGQSINQFSSR